MTIPTPSSSGARPRDYGIATYAYDQRGFGAEPLAGRWPGRWQTRRRWRRRAGWCAPVIRLPLYLLGESMGAAVAIVAMTGETGTPRPSGRPRPVGAGGVGTADDGRRRARRPRHRIRLLPGLTVSGRGIIQVTPSDNTEMLRGLARDPMVIKATRIDAIYGWST